MAELIPFIHNNRELQTACEKNLTQCVLKNTIPFNWNFGLYGACLSCNETLINRMIELGANDFGWALRGISQHGSLTLIHKIETLCETHKNPETFDWCLTAACIGNNINAVNYYLSKPIKDLNSAVRVACENGHKQIFYILLEYAQFNIDLTLALAGACFGFRNKKDFPKIILDKLCDKLNQNSMYNNLNYFNCAFYEASYSGLKDIVQLLVEKANKLKIKYDIVHIIRGATLGNHRDLIQEYIKYDQNLLTFGYYEAAYKGNKDLVLWYEQTYKVYNSEAYLTGLKQSGRVETWFDKERYKDDTKSKW